MCLLLHRAQGKAFFPEGANRPSALNSLLTLLLVITFLASALPMMSILVRSQAKKP